MDQPTIALVIALVIVAAAAVWLVVRNQRSQRLKERFGSEYDRTVQATGARPAAEADLMARAKRVASFDIRPLSPGDRERFEELWRQTQAAFVATIHYRDLFEDLLESAGLEEVRR